MTDLFSRDEFAAYLHEDVDNSSTDVCQRLASGWLKSATGLTDWPVPVPDQLFGWGLELAALAYRNPDAATSESIDDHSVSWARSQRMEEILAAARAAYSSAAVASYSFPDPDW